MKVNAIRMVESGGRVVDVARSFDVDPNVLRRWRRDFRREPEFAFPGAGRTPEKRLMDQLRGKLERQAAEIDHLRASIQRIQNPSSN
jgi:transposase-like protein